MTRTHTCIAFALALLVAIAAAPRASAETGAADSASETAAPLTLDQCVLIALERNPGLTASEQSVVGAGAGLTRARSPYYPQLTLGLLEAVANDPADGTDRTEEASLVLRQTIWESGRRESVQESAARLESAEFGYASAEQSLVEQVATDYYGVLASDRLVEVAQAGVESSARHLEEVQARIEVGVSAAVDEATAQDDLARAELSLIDTRGLVRVARARLKTTMGLPQQTALHLAPPPSVAEEDLPTLGQALAAAEQNRPDILSVAAAVEASRNAVRQAEIRRGPVADVSGRYDWGYSDWARRDPSWDLALTLSWALFDGYATAADVDAARASLARSEAQLQALRDQVGLEVESALTEVERATERVAATAKSVAAAQARLRAAEGKYQQGVGILLEVTDARSALTSAQANQIQAAYDYRTALVALERVLGTLSPPESDVDQ
jgi:outer membrane protein TolC